MLVDANKLKSVSEVKQVLKNGEPMHKTIAGALQEYIFIPNHITKEGKYIRVEGIGQEYKQENNSVCAKKENVSLLIKNEPFKKEKFWIGTF